MVKHSLLVLLASLLVVLFATELGFIFNLIDRFHFLLTSLLANVFAGGEIGSIIRKTLVLFLIPFIIALIPALIYWGIKRSNFSYFAWILWGGWLILATLLVVR